MTTLRTLTHTVAEATLPTAQARYGDQAGKEMQKALEYINPGPMTPPPTPPSPNPDTRVRTQHRGVTLAAAMTSRILAEVCGAHPLNTIKSNFQAQTPLSIMIKRYRQNPLRLYDGLTSGLQLGVAKQGLKFLLFEDFKAHIKYQANAMGYDTTHNSTNRAVICAAAGAAAGFSEGFILSPIEYPMVQKQICTVMPTSFYSRFELESAMQTKYPFHGREPGTLHFMKYAWSKGGYPLVFRGALATALRSAMGNAVVFGGKHGIQSKMEHYFPSTALGSSSFMSGTLAGALSTIPSTPFDVIRAHQQRIPMKETAPGVIKTAQNLYAEQGLKPFYRGMGSKCSRLGFMYGFSWYFYDRICDSINKVVD